MANNDGKCDFCRNFDFSKAEIIKTKDSANIALTICNTKTPKEKQFKYCPECGRDLTGAAKKIERLENVNGYSINGCNVLGYASGKEIGEKVNEIINFLNRGAFNA